MELPTLETLVSYTTTLYKSKVMQKIIDSHILVLQSHLYYLFLSTDNIVGLNVTEGNDTPFGARTRKGMFRTVAQLYKVTWLFQISFIPSARTTFNQVTIPLSHFC